jgi:hypothetical protein
MGVQFWWFYDVIAVAAVLVCMFVTIKRGIMKAAVSLVGFAIALGVAFSLSSSLAGSLYTKVIRNSNVKKLDQSLTEGRYMDELENYLENLGYNIDIDGSQLKKICFTGENVDENIYKYVNNINSRKVEEEGIFMNKLHEGYASSLHGFITKQLSEYSAEYAAREIESSPAKFYGFLKLLSDDDNLRPAAEYIVDNYLAAPYTSEIKLIVFIVAAIFLMLITIFIETEAGKNSQMEPSIVTHAMSGIIGFFKGAVIVFVIAVMVRLYVVLGSNKMLFFNHDAIDKTYVFKYIYNIIKDM